MLLRHFHFLFTAVPTSRKSATPRGLLAIANSRTSYRFDDRECSPGPHAMPGGEPGLCARQEKRRLKETYGNIFIHDKRYLVLPGEEVNPF
jgi:hypothetical protein